MEILSIPHQTSNNCFDKHEGCKRTEHKVFNRSFWYKGFEVKRNANVPVGADGLWEIPELKWFGKGGMQKGFLTVSMIQSREAIDRYMEFNV
jgi:hypothetical protein